MAMLRLPTRQSGGKANLHQGAIGAGIDLASGLTLHAVSRNEVVTEHPDTGDSIRGLAVPHWDTLLTVAARAYELTGLGYLGVDLVLDQDKGPLLLELNARPGLAIQIANAAGLMHRVKLVEAHFQELPTVEARIAFAREHFPREPYRGPVGRFSLLVDEQYPPFPSEKIWRFCRVVRNRALTNSFSYIL